MRSFYSLILSALCATIAADSLSAQTSFTREVPHTTAAFDPGSGSGQFTIGLQLFEDPAAGTTHPTLAFSLGVVHDPLLLTAVSVQPGEALAALNGGAGPDYFIGHIIDGGIMAGCVYSLISPSVTLDFEEPGEIADVTYQTVPSSFMGQMDPTTTMITPAAGLTSAALLRHGT